MCQWQPYFDRHVFQMLEFVVFNDMFEGFLTLKTIDH